MTHMTIVQTQRGRAARLGRPGCVSWAACRACWAGAGSRLRRVSSSRISNHICTLTLKLHTKKQLTKLSKKLLVFSIPPSHTLEEYNSNCLSIFKFRLKDIKIRIGDYHPAYGGQPVIHSHYLEVYYPKSSDLGEYIVVCVTSRN